jgi:hypothetical protein
LAVRPFDFVLFVNFATAVKSENISVIISLVAEVIVTPLLNGGNPFLSLPFLELKHLFML